MKKILIILVLLVASFVSNAQRWSYKHYNAADSTGVVVNAGYTMIKALNISSTGAACFVKFYNKATAATSADTPVFTVLIPVNTTTRPSLEELIGSNFTLGLSVRVTGAIADNDSSQPTNKPFIDIGY